MKYLQEYLKNYIPDTLVTFDDFSCKEDSTKFNLKGFLLYVEETKKNLKKYEKEPFDLKNKIF
jgi:hypothetical protein